MTDIPLFSVIIPTYHRNDLLAKCLDCLAPGVQTLPADQYEVIVSDDGYESTAQEMIQQNYPWVKWVAGFRKGPAANRNNGAKYATGEWLAFTDDDCLPDPHHEQPGLNMLVFSSGVKITNLTLPPVYMESTWAGDYPDKYEHYWTDSHRKPYLIHWAGTRMDIPRPINQIFYNYLTASEKAEWDEQVKTASVKRERQNRSFRAFARKIKRAFLTLNQP
jgi:glycosyltransferase involved in cell wall biosynthesis